MRHATAIDLSGYRMPALLFSGGKDSLACLYLLRDQLDRVAVYWLNAGDGCPETREVIEKCRQWIPHFVEIRSDVKAWRDQHGMPSDLAPASGHWLGIAYGMAQSRIVGRFECCWSNRMLPMHARMLEDGVDAVIRGTKLSDTGRIPAEGKTAHYDVILPIKDWTHDDVFEYLREVGAPVNPIYEHFGGVSAPECMGCSAWWDDRKAAYLKARHPQAHASYVENLRLIRDSVRKHAADLDRELEE